MNENDNNKSVIGIKTISGIFFNLAPLGLLLLVVGCMLGEFCFYNPTILDATKKAVSLTEIEGWYYFLLPLLLSAVFLLLIAVYIRKDKWKEKTNILILFASLVLVCCIASHIICDEVIANSLLYVEGLGDVALKCGVGYYLSVVGIYLYSSLILVFTICMKYKSKK